jgi:hypothetical protein
MNPVKLAQNLDSKYRKVRRFVESDNFKSAFNRCDDKVKIVNLIRNGETKKLKEWAYSINPLVDAPLRWLRDKAKQYRIKDYSRKTKVQIVDELTAIHKQTS